MFNITTLQSAAEGQVGFRKSNHPYYALLPAAYKASASKFYVNTLSGIDFNVIEHSAYSSVEGINLVIGEKYKIMNNGGSPDFTNVGAADSNVGTKFVATGTTPTAWGSAILRLISCNEYIANIYNDEVANVLTQFINNSKEDLQSVDLLSNQSVIAGVSDVDNLVTKNSRFVGFLIEPHEGNNIKNVITKLSLLVSEAQSGLKVYLYSTAQKTALTSFTFAYTTPLSMQWKAVSDFIIKYDDTSTSDDVTYTGGVGQKYLLGYFEDDLTGSAVYIDWGDTLDNWSIYGKYMSVMPIEIPSADVDSVNIPGDLSDLAQYHSSETHGLGFTFTANCDYTNVLKTNIDMFSEAIQYAVGLRILEDAIASVSDGSHNPVKDSALPLWKDLVKEYRGKLYGGYINTGQEAQYQKGIIELLTADFSGIDPVCLKRSINEWTIGSLV